MTKEAASTSTSELRQVLVFGVTICCVLLGTAGALLAAGF